MLTLLPLLLLLLLLFYFLKIVVDAAVALTFLAVLYTLVVMFEACMMAWFIQHCESYTIVKCLTRWAGF